MERSQEIPVKPLGKWKHHIRNPRQSHTLHVFLFFFVIFGLRFSLWPWYMSPWMLFFSHCQEFAGGKMGLTHERDCFAFGHVVHVSTGKFSGPGPDGTCGSVGSQHCLVSSIWGWTFPCQCRVSTTKVQPLFLVDSRPGGLTWWSTNSGSWRPIK